MRPQPLLQRRGLAALCTLALLPWVGHAQPTAAAYPAKPVRIVVTGAPGGGTDAVARLLADTLAASFKGSFVADNKPGAGGVLASEAVARSPADGYTLMVAQNGHTLNPVLMRKLPYDTFKDFTAVAPIAASPLVLVASATTGTRSFRELADAARKAPGSLSMAVSDASTRLASEMLAEAMGTAITPIIYKGTGPAMADVAGGHVGYSITTMASVLPYKATGKVQFLAVLAPARSAFLPEVPTLAEQGGGQVQVRGWWGLFAPARLPQPLADQLAAATRSALASPDFQKRLAAFAAEPWVATPAEFDAALRQEAEVNLRAARKAGIEPE